MELDKSSASEFTLVYISDESEEYNGCGFGYIEDSYDSRDWVAENCYGILLDKGILDTKIIPETLDYTNELPPVMNQGDRGTCSACVAATMKAWQERRDCGYKGMMSVNFIYTFRSNLNSSGMYGRDTMNILTKRGCCTDISYPYDSPKNSNELSNEIIEEASKYKISGYASVNTIQGVKESLLYNGPCYISFVVYNKGPTLWKPSNIKETQIGGHAMTIIGYNDQGFILRNSWGSKWANKGCTIFPYSDFGRQRLIFTTIDMKGSVSPRKTHKKKTVKKVSKLCCC